MAAFARSFFFDARHALPRRDIDASPARTVPPGTSTIRIPGMRRFFSLRFHVNFRDVCFYSPPNRMITHIAHIGIAVRDLDSARRTFASLLDLPPSEVERVEDQRVDVSSFHLGPANLELTCATDPSSPIARFIDKRGEGMHHIAFETDDIRADIARLKSRGVRLIDEEPRTGADGCLVAFVHPASAGGVLVELSQRV
jgi:methylmalonyl-CoA/ethylmalonyl-CoA epimerase